MLQYLLDTNIAIYVIKRRPAGAVEQFIRHAGQMAISSITLAELLHGAEKSSARERSLEVVQEFIKRLAVLQYGPAAARHYGEIRASLEKRGQVIGVNDLHIAAHARSLGLTLVTNNLREFERVEGLSLTNWVAAD